MEKVVTVLLFIIIIFLWESEWYLNIFCCKVQWLDSTPCLLYYVTCDDLSISANRIATWYIHFSMNVKGCCKDGIAEWLEAFIKFLKPERGALWSLTFLKFILALGLWARVTSQLHHLGLSLNPEVAELLLVLFAFLWNNKKKGNTKYDSHSFSIMVWELYFLPFSLACLLWIMQ